jgi:DNA-binding NarL/FixJ family response regulator
VAATLATEGDRKAVHGASPSSSVTGRGRPSLEAAEEFEEAVTVALDALEVATDPAVRAALFEAAAASSPPSASRRLWRDAADEHRAGGDLAAAARAARNGTSEPLTDREVQVLALMGEGLSNASIADRLAIATTTAEDHVRAVLRKTGARTRIEASVLAGQRRR